MLTGVASAGLYHRRLAEYAGFGGAGSGDVEGAVFVSGFLGVRRGCGSVVLAAGGEFGAVVGLLYAGIAAGAGDSVSAAHLPFFVCVDMAERNAKSMPLAAC